MLLNELNLHTRGKHADNVQVKLDFTRVVDVRRDANNNVTEVMLSTSNDYISVANIGNNVPKYTCFDPDTYYLLLDGSLTVKKDQSQDVTITPTYQSGTLTDYKDLWKPMSNQPVIVVMEENAKMISFSIKDDSYPWANSVKAAMVANSTFTLEANDNSFVIVVGSHRLNGGAIEDEDMSPYKIGGPESRDPRNPRRHYDEVLDPGTLTIEANGTCSIVYIEK